MATRFTKKCKRSISARLNQVLDMLKFKCWFYEQAIQDGSDERVKQMLPDHLPAEIQLAYDHAHR